MTWHKFCLFWLFIVSTTACEHGIDLRGRLKIPALPDELPAELMIRATMSNGAEFWTDPLPLCEDYDYRTINLHAFSFGCAVAGPVRVSGWIYKSVDKQQCVRRTDAKVTGAIIYHPDEPHAQCNVVGVSCPPPPSQVIAYGRTNAEGKAPWSVFRCRNGTISFDITLAPNLETTSGPTK